MATKRHCINIIKVLDDMTIAGEVRIVKDKVKGRGKNSLNPPLYRIRTLNHEYVGETMQAAFQDYMYRVNIDVCTPCSEYMDRHGWEYVSSIKSATGNILGAKYKKKILHGEELYVLELTAKSMVDDVVIKIYRVALNERIVIGQRIAHGLIEANIKVSELEDLTNESLHRLSMTATGKRRSKSNEGAAKGVQGARAGKD